LDTDRSSYRRFLACTLGAIPVLVMLAPVLMLFVLVEIGLTFCEPLSK